MEKNQKKRAVLADTNICNVYFLFLVILFSPCELPETCTGNGCVQVKREFTNLMCICIKRVQDNVKSFYTPKYFANT